MKPSEITVLILTLNEAPNLRRCLECLRWTSQIIVLDSGSTDETLEIARSFPQVRVQHRDFDSFAGQCNFGLAQITTPWVLSLDADYILPENFSREIELLADDAASGYVAKFAYCIEGRELRSSLYPPRTILYRRDHATYRDEGHGHRVTISGPTAQLQSMVQHDDRKPLDRWLSEQNRYAQKEACYLLETDPAQLNTADRIRRRIVFAPMLVFLYVALARGLVFDGPPGWFYIFQRTLAEIMISLRLLEQTFKSTS